ncbi:hypothetical protein [Candidatus Nucleicultrix amoebiphila]|uniref:DUF5667 domain-containing protein n=1 Tax=Candidatus Nucleicultrix amoebiphila FS5 TaxID=1414854 RepID=A0A1W6N332_9PROT|nr:hypothetical protein [Candidatus Nucleicultrix amoebiphila]ARN84307.1 hypothetical protein GQ61_01985 [Candidatus Nucleicultrix amoebiphila FS5]
MLRKIILNGILATAYFMPTLLQAEPLPADPRDAHLGYIFLDAYSRKPNFQKCMNGLSTDKHVVKYQSAAKHLKELSEAETSKTSDIQKALNKTCKHLDLMVKDCYNENIVDVRELTAPFREGRLCATYREKLYEARQKDTILVEKNGDLILKGKDESHKSKSGKRKKKKRSAVTPPAATPTPVAAPAPVTAPEATPAPTTAPEPAPAPVTPTPTPTAPVPAATPAPTTAPAPATPPAASTTPPPTPEVPPAAPVATAPTTPPVTGQ